MASVGPIYIHMGTASENFHPGIDKLEAMPSTKQKNDGQIIRNPYGPVGKKYESKPDQRTSEEVSRNASWHGENVLMVSVHMVSIHLPPTPA